jgi:transposase
MPSGESAPSSASTGIGKHRGGSEAREDRMDEEERSWFVGVDWASQTHHVRLSDAKGRKVGEKVFAHGGVGLAEMAAWIVSLTGTPANQVFVAIEVPHGPVVESLMERGFRVHAINPKQLDRFRDRFSPAGAKDDSRDAQVLADALRTDPRCFRPLTPLDPVVVELREWSRMADDLRDERNRLGNRVREQLWRYYPQILDLVASMPAMSSRACASRPSPSPPAPPRRPSLM